MGRGSDSRAPATPSQSNPAPKLIQASLTAKSWESLKPFRNFLESATADEKLTLLQKTVFRPRKRLKKLMDKREKLEAIQMAQRKKNTSRTMADESGQAQAQSEEDELSPFKCPVYKCTEHFTSSQLLDAHF